jgi:hypothetical protein
MVHARANSLKQPGENWKGGNNIVQVNKYNTWASEGRWQAASHRALDKLAQVKAMVTTTAKCNVRGCGIPGCRGRGRGSAAPPKI